MSAHGDDIREGIDHVDTVRLWASLWITGGTAFAVIVLLLVHACAHQCTPIERYTYDKRKEECRLASESLAAFARRRSVT